MNSRWNSVQRTTINWDAAFTAPLAPEVELTPREEIQRLEARIADADETIRAYGGESTRAGKFARGQITHYETQIQKLKSVIYAADHEAFVAANANAADPVASKEQVHKALNLIRATTPGYPADLKATRRAAFVKKISERGN